MGATLNQRPAFERLPSGRHGLTREAVADSQRGRLLEAMMQAVADKGCAETTVGDVVEKAGVSRRTFYEQFPDKETCFLAAYGTGVELMLGRIREAVKPLADDDWRGRAATSIETFMEVLAAEPAFAWSLVVEVMAAGREALARRAAILGIFTEQWRRLFERARLQDPSLPELPPEVFVALCGGHEELVREHLRTRGAASLPELAGPVLRVVLATFGTS